MDDCDWLLSVEKACDWLRIEPGVTVNSFLGHPVVIHYKDWKDWKYLNYSRPHDSMYHRIYWKGPVSATGFLSALSGKPVSGLTSLLRYNKSR